MVEAKAQHKEVVKEYSGKENVDEDQEKPNKEQEKNNSKNNEGL